MRFVGLLMVGMSLTACGEPPAPTDPDAQVGDGSIGGGGLTIKFESTRTDLPGPITSKLELDQVVINASYVKAFGNAATGDARTTTSDYTMRWKGTEVPAPIRFDEAPVGYYGSIELRIARVPSDSDAFDLEGDAEKTVGTEEVRYPFNIDSKDIVLTVTVPVQLNLDAGSDATIVIAVDLARLVNMIDFDLVAVDNSELVIDDVNLAEMPVVTSALQAAFTFKP